MTTGPRYRKPFRRRAEGKTDYHKRLKLLKSRKLRAVIRVSSNHTKAQVVDSQLKGDRVLVSAFSKELTNDFDWKPNTGNIPAAYLTGYLAGKRAIKEGIEGAILDLGLFYHKNRVLAAFKGLLDAGLDVPHRDTIFPESLEGRYDGSHIEDYAKVLKKEEPEKYQKVFSGYLKEKKIDPTKFTSIFTKTLEKIDKIAK